MSHQHLSMLPSQQMRLEQRLTPQLIQSMEILQLPLLALEARVREELEQNPVLEEAEQAAPAEPKPALEDPPASAESLHEAQSFERLEQMSRDMEFDPGDLAFGRGGSAPSGERDAKMDAMANTASRGLGLKEQLLADWALLEVDDEVRKAGEAIIDWMDEDGYLRFEHEHRPSDGHGDFFEAPPLIIRRTEEESRQLLEEIAYSHTPPLDGETLEKALAEVQTLEPTGIAARDLTECLLIQLAASNNTDPLCEELVRGHLVSLAKNQFPQVAKALGKSIDDVKAALKIVGKLHHHPGLLIDQADVPTINPDIIVDYADDGDSYTVRPARGSSPRLQISHKYREMLQDKNLDKEAREFIRKRIESAGTIIDAIAYRRQRVLQVAEILVDRQREFFDFGPQFLKPMRMSDLAEELHCDPSTISRTVDGKYMQCPRGIFPLRQFFTGGTKDADGEEVTWSSLRAKVKEIIDGEDKTNPLKDEEIMRRFSELTGTPISRRTIAKYRAQLGIPSNRERRAY